MTTGRLPPTANLLLASLPAEQLRRLIPQLEPVQLIAGELLQKPGHTQSHAIFPCSGIISMNYEMADGIAVAIGLVGAEGVVGISLFMDGTAPTGQCEVQTAGEGYRLSASAVRRELHTAGQLHVLALRYIQAVITQMAQTAVCNRHHSLDQQICRWLLLSLDRIDSNQLAMTHETIAQLLGVRREGVTAAAGKLQESGIINYSRGRISVIDRSGLEKRVCECYAVVTREYDRLLPPRTQCSSRHLKVVHG